MRAFVVKMPSGSRYWTVLDEQLDVVPVADRFLRELRFGRDRAESTTKTYAGAVALYLRWCSRTGRDWTTAASEIGLFMTWLKYAPVHPDGGSVVSGPGAPLVRGERRINRVLVAVRGFLSFAIAANEAPDWILGQLYELADTRDLPIEAQGEDARLSYRMRARHRLHEPENPVDRASDEEIVTLFRECRSARDRLIVLLLARAGLRRGAVAGLRRSDMHLSVDYGRL
jgi:site-specific recombinase XerD